MRILILESDTNRQRQLRTILVSLGHKSSEMETATDIKSATNLLRKKRFEVMFVSMFDTATALPFIKDTRASSGGKSMLCVGYSSEVTKENVVAAVEAGASKFLGYPFSVSDVEEVLKQAPK